MKVNIYHTHNVAVQTTDNKYNMMRKTDHKANCYKNCESCKARMKYLRWKLTIQYLKVIHTRFK